MKLPQLEIADFDMNDPTTLLDNIFPDRDKKHEYVGGTYSLNMRGFVGCLELDDKTMQMFKSLPSGATLEIKTDESKKYIIARRDYKRNKIWVKL